LAVKHPSPGKKHKKWDMGGPNCLGIGALWGDGEDTDQKKNNTKKKPTIGGGVRFGWGPSARHF